jgi:hypothetical protein
MKNRNIQENEINRITQNCKPREQAFFTVMRQSGLKPHTLKQLKIENLEKILEPQPPTPCLIDVPNEKSPTFIGQEAIQYLKKYLQIRARKEKLTPESLLFTAKNNPDKQINTKDVSRTFRETARKLGIGQKVKKGEPSEICLFSLVTFYRRNAKNYLNEFKKNPLKDHEFLRSLYQENAMPLLEIETKVTITIYQREQYQKEIDRQNNLTKEMRQTITKDKEYISSILTLLYNNKGDPETGEAEEIGDYFIELWKKTKEEQRRNLRECWTRKVKLLPYKDIVEELTKTLKRIMKPYEELKKQEPATI